MVLWDALAVVGLGLFLTLSLLASVFYFDVDPVTVLLPESRRRR